jgi:hypothetical protein
MTEESGFDYQHSIFRSVQTGPEAHPTIHPMGPGIFFPSGKRPGREAHLVPTLRMRRAIPPLPHTSLWRGGYLSTLPL